jgi:sugar fermentation stimulation protein A
MTIEIFRWPRPLLEGRLVRRYERFIAEVELASGDLVRAHCVNPGRMEGLVVPGATVFLSQPTKPRALTYTWELLQLGDELIGVNTVLPNQLVKAVLQRQLLPDVGQLESLKSEQPFGRGHRVDFLFEQPRRHFLEVKNCHLIYPDGFGYFPDSTSERATGHVAALQRQVAKGSQATVLFTVQRQSVVAVRPSDVHDGAFARAVRRAAKAGVLFRAIHLKPTLTGFVFCGEVPVDLHSYPLPHIQQYARELESTTGWQRKDGKMAGLALPSPKRPSAQGKN